MLNQDLDGKILAIELIKQIKLSNQSFKNIIRNFSNKIVELRDEFLRKINKDINDWMVGNLDDKLLNELEKQIFKFIS